MHHPTDRITHTTAFVTPVVEHWVERVFYNITKKTRQEKTRQDNYILIRLREENDSGILDKVLKDNIVCKLL